MKYTVELFAPKVEECLKRNTECSKDIFISNLNQIFEVSDLGDESARVTEERGDRKLPESSRFEASSNAQTVNPNQVGGSQITRDSQKAGGVDD